MIHCTHALVFFVLFTARAAAAGAAFELVETTGDGLTLEARDAPETDFPELRVRLHAAAPPAAVAQVVWSGGPGAEEARALERREVLQVDGQARLEHQVLRASILGRREAIVRFDRAEAADGSISIDFTTHGYEGALGRGAPRMTVIRGRWRLMPDGAGGSQVELCMVSDPGGIPAFLAVGVQRALVLELVRDAVRRAATEPATTGAQRP